MVRRASAVVLILPALAAAWSASAAEPAEQTRLRQTVEEFVRSNTQTAAGDVEINTTVRPLPAPCERMEAFLPPGARLWGRASVGVRCVTGGGWTAYVPVHVRVVGDYLVAARPLGQADVISEDDLTRRRGDLTALPAGVITDPAEVVGRSPTLSIAAGQALRRDAVRIQPVVMAGQTVKLTANGASFSVSAEGRALNTAAPGQMVQVRTGAGQTVSGTATATGAVIINF